MPAPDINVTAAPVVIVGGGFGGLYTALALAGRKGHPPILLIEPQSQFLFLPLLFELLSQEVRRWEIAPRYDTLLAGKGVAWLQDRVSSIDCQTRTVLTEAGQTLSYSRLVLATGARTNSFGIPGVEAHTLGFRSLQDVERLQRLISELKLRRRPLQRLAVVGAGATGVELACKLADCLEGAAVVELVEQGSTLLPNAKAFNREQAQRALQRKDVRLRCRSQVMAVSAHQLEIQGPQGQEQLAVDGVIWTAGLRFAAPPILPSPATDSRGRLRCGADLQLINQPGVFALGDIAQIATSEQLPITAQVAFQQAECLASNLMHSLAGETTEPFAFKDLGEMISLGMGEAALTGGGFTLAGPAAFQLRRLAYLARLPGKTQQLKAAAGWLGSTALAWQS